MKDIDQLTDRELSDAVAEEVWGWKRVPNTKLYKTPNGMARNLCSVNDRRETVRLLEWLMQDDEVTLILAPNGKYRVCGLGVRAATLNRAIREAALHVARQKAGKK